jgi:hypothetical protein
MRKISMPLSISGAILVASLLTSTAQAQASRTWVSGVGDDANPCSRTAPCKTFAGAISKTAPGGEIDALDPGGFGAVTITKAITIDGGGGQVASILVSGSHAITVNAGPTDVITLRNLRLNGIDVASPAGPDGIHYVAGAALHVEDCYIFGFPGNGINVATTSANISLLVNNTFLTNNGNGLQIAPTGGNVRSTLVHVRAQGNSSSGIALHPSAGIGAGTIVNELSAVTNGTGIDVSGGKLFLGNSVIAKNNLGVSITGGTVLSYKNNVIDGNTTDGTPLTSTPLN